MVNEDLLLRAEKAETELAELKTNVEMAAKALLHQHQKSWLVVTAMATRIKQLETELRLKV